MSARPTPLTLLVYAKNMRRVAAFYERALGLALVTAAATHTTLRKRGVEIVVHAIPRQYAKDIVIARPPQPREESAFKPILHVADLEAVRVAALATGGRLQGAERAWEADGLRHQDGWDPEGNVVHFVQRVRRKAR